MCTTTTPTSDGTEALAPPGGRIYAYTASDAHQLTVAVGPAAGKEQPPSPPPQQCVYCLSVTAPDSLAPYVMSKALLYTLLAQSKCTQIP